MWAADAPGHGVQIDFFPTLAKLFRQLRASLVECPHICVHVFTLQYFNLKQKRKILIRCTHKFYIDISPILDTWWLCNDSLSCTSGCPALDDGLGTYNSYNIADTHLDRDTHIRAARKQIKNKHFCVTSIWKMMCIHAFKWQSHTERGRLRFSSAIVKSL